MADTTTPNTATNASAPTAAATPKKNGSASMSREQLIEVAFAEIAQLVGGKTFAVQGESQPQGLEEVPLETQITAHLARSAGYSMRIITDWLKISPEVVQVARANITRHMRNPVFAQEIVTLANQLRAAPKSLQ